MPLAPGTNPVGAPYVAKFITNIGSFNLGVPGAGQRHRQQHRRRRVDHAGLQQATGQTTPPFDALGRDYNNDGRGNGFTIPSLLGIDSAPPYYHNGACETLDCVLTNVKHRTSTPGGGPGSQPDALANATRPGPGRGVPEVARLRGGLRCRRCRLTRRASTWRVPTSSF